MGSALTVNTKLNIASGYASSTNSETFAANVVNAVFAEANNCGLDPDAQIIDSEINGGDGDDVIEVNAKNSTIVGGNGNNTLNIDGENNTLKLGDGNNKLTNNSDGAVINFGNGNNTFINNSNNSKANFGDGNNNINSSGNGNSITTGNGNNDVSISGNQNTFSSGDGDNLIYVDGSKNAILTGNGASVINAKGNLNALSTGDGNNVIMIDGIYNTAVVGDGDNKIGLLGNGNKTYIGNGNNYIGFWGDYIGIYSGINGGYGNNIIETLNYTNNALLDSLVNIWKNNHTDTQINKNVIVDKDEEYQGNEKQEFWKNLKSNMSSKEYEMCQKVNLSEIIDGQPRYMLIKLNDGKFHLYEYNSNTKKYNAKESCTQSKYGSFSYDDFVTNGAVSPNDEVFAAKTDKIVTTTTRTDIVKTEGFAYTGVNNFDIQLNGGNQTINLQIAENADGKIYLEGDSNKQSINLNDIPYTSSSAKVTKTEGTPVVKEERISEVIAFVPVLKK